MPLHQCSHCGAKFEITSGTRTVNSLSYLLYPFHGWQMQYRKFSCVTCPNCGTEESDPSIRFLGLFPPKALLYLFALALLLAVVEAIYESSR